MEGGWKIAEVRGALQPEALMPNPLHPAVVHFPLVLAVLFPFVAAVALYASRRPGAGRGAWLALGAMALLLVGSAWLSIETGQQQEDVVERVVSEGLVSGHEEAAEGLLIGSVVLLGVVLAGFARGKAGSAMRWASLVGGVAVLGLAFRVGASGGALVYEHGAASAYVGSSSTTGTGIDAPSGRERRGDDDDDRH
jgi:uncharacterized membrane protein